ncbi:MAG: hypothetical protein ROR55_27470 [Devosia sp.]
MTGFRIVLGVLLVVNVAYTLNVGINHGWNLIEIYLSELAQMRWQGQFLVDFTSYLLLSGLWVAWRGGFSAGAIVLGVAAACLGIIFTSVYVFYLTFRTDGDMKTLFLGVHGDGSRSAGP